MEVQGNSAKLLPCPGILKSTTVACSLSLPNLPPPTHHSPSPLHRPHSLLPTSYRLRLHVCRSLEGLLFGSSASVHLVPGQARIVAASSDDLILRALYPRRRQSDDHCFLLSYPLLRLCAGSDPPSFCARFAERFAAHGSTHRAPRILTTSVTPSLAAPRANSHLRPRHPAHRCIADVTKARAAHAHVYGWKHGDEGGHDKGHAAHAQQGRHRINVSVPWRCPSAPPEVPSLLPV